jgi:hypothetical protein
VRVHCGSYSCVYAVLWVQKPEAAALVWAVNRGQHEHPSKQGQGWCQLLECMRVAVSCTCSRTGAEGSQHLCSSGSKHVCRCMFKCSNIEDYLDDFNGESSIAPLWDIVILDPPKLAPNRKLLDRAEAKYRYLNMAAMQALKPGGLLMTCSCSGAVAQGPQGTFVNFVTAAARHLRRPVSVLREAGAAADHVQDPHFPQGKYLTNLLVRVSAP